MTYSTYSGTYARNRRCGLDAKYKLDQGKSDLAIVTIAASARDCRQQRHVLAAAVRAFCQVLYVQEDLTQFK